MSEVKEKSACACGFCGHGQAHEHANEQIHENKENTCGCKDEVCVCGHDGCGCGDDEDGCGCGHDHTEKNSKVRLILLAVGAAVFGGAFFIPDGHILQYPAFIAAYLLLGYDVLFAAGRNLTKGALLDENFLMSVSTIGAFCIGEPHEAVAVMLFYQIGECLQDMAAGNSRRSIRNLLNLKAETANLETPNGVVSIAPESVQVGQILLVKPGEKFPLDGVLVEGETQADTAPLTGEPVPRVLRIGDEALSGAVNLTGAVRIRVTKAYKESTVAKIMEMVEQAQVRKAPAERFIRQFAKVYTPIVVGAAVLLAVVAPLILQDGAWAEWIRRALVFLVVSCPCALVVSVPLSFFSGIGALSRKGILVKGGSYVQTLAAVDTVVFDKTGTLTKGVFNVTEICPAAGVTEEALLAAAAAAEQFSNHPIAQSICAAYAARYGGHLPHGGAEELSGLGISARFGGDEILCGNGRLMAAHGLECMAFTGLGSVAHVAENGTYLGMLVISDVVREGAAALIPALKKAGITRVVMLTGDRKENAERFGNALGIKTVRAELLPDGKVKEIEELYSNQKGCKIAFVGDGINDAPVLARVDVGIAMGGVGSDAAVEAADAVLMTDEPQKVAEAIRTAKNTMTIVRQNVAFSLVVKFAVLGLAVFGLANMWLAVFADVGVTLLAVLNAVRRK